MPLRSLATLLAPPLCAGCGGHAGAGEPLCEACRRELRWLTGERVLCGVRVFAPLAYEGPARAMVRALKFRGATLAADTMAAQIAAGAPAGLLRGAEGRSGGAAGRDPRALVPVPLHPRRMRKRGFNQAERLAAALGGRTGLPVVDCLCRVGAARTQVGRDRSERLAGVDGTVAVRPGAPFPPRAVLVDDVATTGATLGACAAALRASGTYEVRAVTYARTPGR